MKFFSYPLASLFLILILPLSIIGITKPQVIQQFALSGALTNHYNELDVNDQYSLQVFDLFMKRIDPNKRFLIAEDIASLSIHKYSIDDAYHQARLARILREGEYDYKTNKVKLWDFEYEHYRHFRENQKAS